MHRAQATPIVFLLLAACDAPAEPLTAGDPVAGRAAFEHSCASCHASGDGFDLAYFGFPAFDIIRRGIDHVDRATAGDIVAHIESLGVQPRGTDFRPFQPGDGIAEDDAAFWRELFGTDGWPADVITVEWLRGLDLRDIAVPLPFPLWSSEADESDWMPETSLAAEILNAEDRVVGVALDSYYDAPTVERLLAVIEPFRRVVGNESQAEAPVCAGGAGAHTRPRACFEARRWVSSLAAIHLLREGELREVPFEVAQLWWDVGEAAVSVHFLEAAVHRTTGAAWLYMSSIFAPDGFPGESSGIIEEAGYMGQFLQSTGRARLAVLVTLRRLVSEGPLHRDRPFNAYRDLELAQLRAPQSIADHVLEFGLRYLLDLQAAGHLPEGEDLERARSAVEGYLERFGTGNAERDEELRSLIGQVAEGLESSSG